MRAGFGHILILGLLMLVALSVAVYLFFPKDYSQKLVVNNAKPTVKLQAQYNNPFDKNSQYANPFSQYKNPFTVAK